MRLIVFALAAGAIALAGASPGPAAAPAPWQDAAAVRTALADAEKALVLDGPAAAGPFVRRARTGAGPLADRLSGSAPGAADRLAVALAAAADAARSGDEPALAGAAAQARTAVLAGSYRALLAAVRAGDVDAARSWLLVREFRKPTRFSRPGADATLAVEALAAGTVTPAAAIATIRADLLDTYQARLREALEATDTAVGNRFAMRALGEAELARGYFEVLEPAYAGQRGAAAAASLRDAFDRLVASVTAFETADYASARASVEDGLAAFRAAPLAADEQVRRAGQLLRFLALVPVEYGRGVDDGRVTLDFELQEAITFRDGVAQAFGDLESELARRDPGATERLGTLVAELGDDLERAVRGVRVVDPDELQTRTDQALDLAEGMFPDDWKQAGSTADFDVIRTTLDRLQAAVAAGEYSKAEQARLEAYAFFEFGPEQRLRGLAPDLFVQVEGYFWYGADGLPGLAQLVSRKSSPPELAQTRVALDESLADAEEAVGSGPRSTFAVVSNTAIIVFREGLEAVLILAALMAGMVGAQRQFRKPMLVGAAAALVATAATWAVAQTVMGSLNRYGEKLEAIVSLVAIAVLLVILNWFYHRVYWNEHLAGLHGRKKRLLGVGLGVATAQLLGLAALGFSSVYREGFETTLFLQAIVLDAGAPRVLVGVLIGLAATLAMGVLTIALQRKLPYKKMLIGTGILILWVLVVMVGTTVQVLQKVGWVSVHPISDLRLPYWAGLWFGVFPTWEGILAQAGALVLVVGSYFLAEHVRARRRQAILERHTPDVRTEDVLPA